MNLFALDTSGFSALMSLVVDGEPRAFELGKQEKTAEHLVPRIRDILNTVQLNPLDIDRFAVATGPGSFTGIRIGITTIKAMAYAARRRIAPVNSLAAVAESARLTNEWTSDSLTVVINAFRQQLFVCRFDWSDFPKQAAVANDLTRVVHQSEFIKEVERESHLLVGPGLAALSLPVQEQWVDRVIPYERVGNTSIGVSSLGAACFSDEQTVDAIALLPNYFRGSAAEEKLLAK